MSLQAIFWKSLIHVNHLNNSEMKKKHLFIRDKNHGIGNSLPSSPFIFFQCTKCWVILNSCPLDSLRCKCGNVSIDVDAARAGARDENFLRVLEISKFDE